MTETERFALLEQLARETGELIRALPMCVGCSRPAVRVDYEPRGGVRGFYCDAHAPSRLDDLPYAAPLRKTQTRLLRLGLHRPPKT
jgi:hypothetical protein